MKERSHKRLYKEVTVWPASLCMMSPEDPYVQGGEAQHGALCVDVVHSEGRASTGPREERKRDVHLCALPRAAAGEDEAACAGTERHEDVPGDEGGGAGERVENETEDVARLAEEAQLLALRLAQTAAHCVTVRREEGAECAHRACRIDRRRGGEERWRGR